MSEVAQAPAVNKINCVQLDGLVLLKIIKHCKECLPDFVSGQLLGLDLNNTLEVTFSFPLLNDTDENNDEGNYEVEMLNALTLVHVDNNNVGWYQCTSLSDFYNTDMVQCHLSYQREIPNAVVIVFDPFMTKNGFLALKAFRLTDNFMALAAKEDFSAKALREQGVDYSTVFQEIPIEINNSLLVHAYLFELMESGTMDCTFDRLTVNNSDVLIKTFDDLSSVGGYLDEYTTDMERLKAQSTAASKQRAEYQRRVDALNDENETRKAINLPPLPIPDEVAAMKITDPSKLDGTVISAKIHAACAEVQVVASDTLCRQTLLKSLMSTDGAGVHSSAADMKDMEE